MPEPANSMDGRLVLDWTYEGDCGAQALIRGTFSRSLGGPMPSHVCAWAARGVTCTVRAKSWATPAKPTARSGDYEADRG